MTSLTNSISLVSGLTIVSRFLGLFRDVLFFTCFGVSAIGDAFILAFTLPNLFRRMLGEGTLSSAFIPVYSEVKESHSLQNANDVLNQVLTRLFFLLCIISIVVCLLSWCASNYYWVEGQKWIDGLFLNSIIFPYVLLICISAIIVGALNTHKSFFAGAFSPIILNIAMIGGLAFCYFGMSWRGLELGMALCVAVLIGGIFQTAWPWIQLRQSFDWRWKFNFSSSSGLEKIKGLFLIGAFSAAVSQVNIMVSRFLAYRLDDEGALSYLFLSARLIELPLGVFAISISTVVFPQLSKAFQKEQNNEYKNYFARGFRLTMGLIIPAAIGLALLSDTIVSVFFQWGEFGGKDVMLASEVLVISCFALPFYAMAAYFVKAFHSQKNMKAPLHAAVISLCVNFVLSVVLMQYYGMIGLAWANVISACLQTLFLGTRLNVFNLKTLLGEKIFSVNSIIISSFAMLGILWLTIQQEYFGESKLSSIMELMVLIPIGVFVYGISLVVCGFPELKKYRKKILFGFFSNEQ